MEKFIYVFNENDKNELIKQGFAILKDDISPYIFKNDKNIIGNFSDMKIIKGDVMQF